MNIIKLAIDLVVALLVLFELLLLGFALVVMGLLDHLFGYFWLLVLCIWLFCVVVLFVFLNLCLCVCWLVCIHCTGNLGLFVTFLGLILYVLLFYYFGLLWLLYCLLLLWVRLLFVSWCFSCCFWFGFSCWLLFWLLLVWFVVWLTWFAFAWMRVLVVVDCFSHEIDYVVTCFTLMTWLGCCVCCYLVLWFLI